MAARFLLVRYAKTVWSNAVRIQGQTDTPPRATGHR
jgi:broad specificity phosphatase PhoE